MRDCDNCICCTATGNCTKDLHDEVINKKKVQVGLKRCPVFDGEAKGCYYYQNSSYYHQDRYEEENKQTN
ncbi:hypothetical protein [Bacteroides sp.]|uniref:hypothetical protein n=1 Tax=Bacteroides sp. TaxID=29523 RepID=UPI003A951DAE